MGRDEFSFLPYLCYVLKNRIESRKKIGCFVHFEAKRRKQADNIRSADTSKYFLLE